MYTRSFGLLILPFVFSVGKLLHLIYILCLMLTERWACEGGRPDWKVFVFLQVGNHHQGVSFPLTPKDPSPIERMEVAR